MNHYVNTTFLHGSGLTRNLTFNGSIYSVLYLQILRFYLVWQKIHQSNNILRAKKLYLPYQIYVHTTFYHGIGLTENWTLKWMYLSYLICAHNAFLLCTTVLLLHFLQSVYSLTFISHSKLNLTSLPWKKNQA